MLDKESRNLGTDGTTTRTMVVNIKSMAHVCSNTFLSIFLRRDTMVFWKMSLLHWLTKLTHQTLYREKTIGEVFWRQWRHGDWTLKTGSEILFALFLPREHFSEEGHHGFWKMSLLHWLTKLTHQIFYREKAIGEVFWRQWHHGDWTLKTVSKIAYALFLALDLYGL